MSGVASRQRQLLPALVSEIRAADPQCGIVLQGSVQHGLEREWSDIDLTVVVSPEFLAAPRHNRLITPENAGRMIRVCDEATQLNIDINWYDAAQLRTDFETKDAKHFFIFCYGEILHDPLGLAAACQKAGRRYFDTHPVVAEAWVKQNAELRRRKLDPGYPLEYPRWWPEFAMLLASLD